MSLSAPVSVQVREYIDPAIGVATLEATLTVMVGSGDEKDHQTVIRNNYFACKIFCTLHFRVKIFSYQRPLTVVTCILDILR